MGSLPRRMAPRYAHVHVEGDWGIRLGKGNITIEVWDRKDRKVGIVSIGSSGIRIRGKTRRKPTENGCDELNK
jgi:hypothetical protein